MSPEHRLSKPLGSVIPTLISLRRRETIFVLMVGLLAAAVLSCRPMAGTITSPDGTYDVKLTESLGNDFLLFGCRTDAYVYRDGVLFARSWGFFFSDDANCEIKRRYPTNRWETNQILRFEKSRYSASRDTIVITNNTGHSVSFLRVEAFDLFLLINIQPLARIELDIPHMTSPSRVEVDGALDTGNVFKRGGVSFDGSKEIVRYCVSIESDNVLIGSPSLEGRTTGGSPVPMSPKCD